MEILEGKKLKIEVDLHGGTLHSIIDKENNEELMYQIEEGSWPNQDVVIFPHVGTNSFDINGKHYEISTRHGLLRNADFKFKEKGENYLKVYYESSEESKKVFPFDFEFILTYKLEDYKLIEHVEIVNKSKEILPCMYGSHLAIKTNEKGIVLLNENRVLHPLNEKGLIDLDKVVILPETLTLTKDLFKKYDTLVIENKSNHLEVKTGFGYTVNYKFDCPNFAIWSNANKGNYVCIEPWWGISNIINESKELKNREFINLVEDKKEFEFSIEFNKD